MSNKQPNEYYSSEDDPSSEDEEYHDLEEDHEENLLASIATVVVVPDHISTQPKPNSYRAIHSKSSSSNSSSKGSTQKSNICLVRDSLVSLAAIPKNTSIYPQRYQTDIDYSMLAYGVSEEDEENNTSILSHTITSEVDMVDNEKDEDDIEEIEDDTDNCTYQEEQLENFDVDEAVMSPKSVHDSLVKLSISDHSSFIKNYTEPECQELIDTSKSLSSTLRSSIRNNSEQVEVSETLEQYDDVEEELEYLDTQRKKQAEWQENESEESSTLEDGVNGQPINFDTSNENVTEPKTIEQSVEQPSSIFQGKQLDDKLLFQSISLFKQYKSGQALSQSVAVGPKQCVTEDLRVSKILNIPSPKLPMEDNSQDNIETMKKENQLLKMQLLEQHRMIEESKRILQERIEKEREVIRDQALKDYLGMKKRDEKQNKNVFIEDFQDAPNTKTQAIKSETPKRQTIGTRLTEKVTPKKLEVIEIPVEDFENSQDLRKHKEIQSRKYLEMRKQKIEEAKQKKERPSEPVKTDNTLILKNMKQPNKTNKLLVRNALLHLCLAGEVNKREREDVFQAMQEYEDIYQMVLLVREVNVPAFRALYVMVTDPNAAAPVGSSTSTTDSHRTDTSNKTEGETKKDQVLVKKIIGKGPKYLTEEQVDVFCRYDSGGKKLSKLASKSFGVTTDVAVLKSVPKNKMKK